MRRIGDLCPTICRLSCFCVEDESGAAALRTVELDEFELNSTGVHHREVDIEYRRYF